MLFLNRKISDVLLLEPLMAQLHGYETKTKTRTFLYCASKPPRTNTTGCYGEGCESFSKVRSVGQVFNERRKGVHHAPVFRFDLEDDYCMTLGPQVFLLLIPSSMKALASAHKVRVPMGEHFICAILFYSSSSQG